MAGRSPARSAAFGAPRGAAASAAAGRNAVWIDGVGDLADMPSHTFRAEPTERLAGASELASYMVVVTTFGRCAREFQRADVRGAAAWQGRSSAAWAADDSRRSPLMALRWLRLVVDEGHCLGGARESDLVDEAANAFISQIAAERRWVLSGTPTVGTSLRGALRQLHNLLRFLREPQYGLGSLQRFMGALGTPFVGSEPRAREGLLRLLQPVMVRHATRDLIEHAPRARVHACTPHVPGMRLACMQVRHTKKDLHLPEPVWLPEYDGVRPWDRRVHKTEPEWTASVFQQAAEHVVASLAEPRRLVRAGGSRPVKAVVFSRFINDLEQVGHHLTLSEGDAAVAQHYGQLRSTELSRFRNGKAVYRACPRCGFANDETTVGDRCGRRLLEITYDLDPALPNGLGAGDEFSRTWPVEEERILLRDFMHPDGWRPWTAQDYHRFGDLSAAQKRCIVRGSIGVAGSTLPRPGGHDRLVTLRGFGTCGAYFGPARPTGRPPYLGQPAGWVQHGVPYTPQPILRGVPWLSRALDTHLLLLCEDGTHGLDLSFVTHLFLVHRISDPALVSQVVSRAHRMGCDPHHGVHVQTLHLFDDAVS